MLEKSRSGHAGPVLLRGFTKGEHEKEGHEEPTCFIFSWQHMAEYNYCCYTDTRTASIFHNGKHSLAGLKHMCTLNTS